MKSHNPVMTDTGIPYDDPDWLRGFAEFAINDTGLHPARVKEVIDTAAAEVLVGASLIEGLLAPGRRILDVGAGVGLLALDLHVRGYDVVAIEPGASGFGDNAQIGRSLKKFAGVADNFALIDREAKLLCPEVDGEFDLVYSSNVLEHMIDLEENLKAMSTVLAGDGVMVHTCPNYHIPYEPHYALPLVPFVPALTTRFKPSLGEDELWRSLNFITLSRMRCIARKLKMDITFKPAMLFNALDRLGSDETFADRHKGLVLNIYRVLAKTRLLNLLKYLPPMFATPMTFRLTHKKGRSSP